MKHKVKNLKKKKYWTFCIYVKLNNANSILRNNSKRKETSGLSYILNTINTKMREGTSEVFRYI